MDRRELISVLHQALLDVETDADAESDLARDLTDVKGEPDFIRAIYHKMRRSGVPVLREHKRHDLIVDGVVIEAKVFSPWTVMRPSNGGKDRSFDDFAPILDVRADIAEIVVDFVTYMATDRRSCDQFKGGGGIVGRGPVPIRLFGVWIVAIGSRPGTRKRPR